MHNFINKNRVTIPKAAVSALEENFANLSIQDESLPWYSQSIPKDISEQTNNADVDVDKDIIPEEDEDIPLETENPSANKSPIPATLFVPKIMSVDESCIPDPHFVLKNIMFPKRNNAKETNICPGYSSTENK